MMLRLELKNHLSKLLLAAPLMFGCTKHDSAEFEEPVSTDEALAYVEEIDANAAATEHGYESEVGFESEMDGVDFDSKDDVPYDDIVETGYQGNDAPYEQADNNSVAFMTEPEVPPLDPATAQTGTYVVRPGDTLSEIAFRILGTSKRWRELVDYNQITNPERIYPGDVIKYEKAQEGTVFADAKEEVTVKKGDSLSSISAKLFGSQKGWRYLWRLNATRIPDPNRIYEGQVLTYFAVDRNIAH